PRLPQRQRRPRRPAAPTNPQRQAAQPHRPDAGPDLPHNEDEFVRLVRRAFCAPHLEPKDEEVGNLIDELGERVWDRLHTFERELQFERVQLDQVLDESDEELTKGARKALRERCWSLEAELKLTVRRAANMIEFCAKTLAERLGTLMYRRYGH